MAYLDTSVIRNVGKAVTHLGASHFTSVFTVIELVSGCLDSYAEYSFRRPVICALLDSNVVIDWDMPEAKLTQGFDYFRHHCWFKERRVGDLRLLLDDIEASNTRENLTERLNRRKLVFGYEFFRDYDDTLGREFIEATVSGHTEIRGAYQRSVEQGYVPSDLRLRTFLSRLGQDRPDLDDAITRYALVEVLVHLPDAQVPDLDKPDIFDSYNGALDTYVRALSSASTNMASTSSRPGRNDAADLAHLLYVKVGESFATDDQPLATRVRLAGAQVINSATLRAEIGI